MSPGLRRRVRALAARSPACGPELAREVRGLAGAVALQPWGVSALAAEAAAYRAARGDAPRAECGCYRCHVHFSP